MKKGIGNSRLTMLLFLLGTVCFGHRAFAQSDRPDRIAAHSKIKYRQGLLSVIILPCRDEAKFRVYILNPEKEKVTIRVYNGTIVDFFVTTEDSVYDRFLNLEQLEDGIYVIDVLAGEEKVEKSVMIGTIPRGHRWATIN